MLRSSVPKPEDAWNARQAGAGADAWGSDVDDADYMGGTALTTTASPLSYRPETPEYADLAVTVSTSPPAGRQDGDAPEEALYNVITPFQGAGVVREGTHHREHVRCALIDGNLRSNVPLIPMPARLKLVYACDQ